MIAPLPSHASLDILGYGGDSQERPTLDSLAEHAASQGREVTSPQQLLEMCCQFPACYDPLYELCIDTCRKCETVYPVTSWLPCPPLLNIPDCTSPNLSWMVCPLSLLLYPNPISRAPYLWCVTRTSAPSVTSSLSTVSRRPAGSVTSSPLAPPHLPLRPTALASLAVMWTRPKWSRATEALSGTRTRSSVRGRVSATVPGETTGAGTAASEEARPADGVRLSDFLNILPDCTVQFSMF